MLLIVGLCDDWRFVGIHAHFVQPVRSTMHTGRARGLLLLTISMTVSGTQHSMIFSNFPIDQFLTEEVLPDICLPILSTTVTSFKKKPTLH